MSLSEKINGKFEFSWGVLSARELPPSKLYFAAIFFAKLTPPLHPKGPKTFDWRFSSQTEPPSAATRLVGVVAGPPSPLPESHCRRRKI
jgi:hypothetical protein